MSIYKWIEYLALADLALIWGMIIGLASHYRKLISIFKILYIYICLVGVTELLSKFYVYFWEGNNLYLFYLFIIGEFALLAALYLKMLEDKKPLKGLKIFFYLVTLLVASYSFWKIKVAPSDFDLYSKLLINAVMVVLASIFFIRTLKEPGRYLKNFNALAYFNSAILFYFSGTFLLFVIFNQMINAKADSVYLWGINALLTLIFHSLFLISLWQKDSLIQKS